MQRNILLDRHKVAARPLVATLGLALSVGSACADDPNPYYLGVSTGITHSSNVFALPSNISGGVEGDTYYSLGLLAGIDQPFGRQHFTASGNVKYNKFSNLTDLNNTSYGLNTQLDWQALDRWSGTVSLALNQNLASYSTTTGQQLRVKNVETDSQFLARAQYGLISLLALEGQYIHQQVRYSAPQYAGYELSQDNLRAGLKYRPSGLLTLGTYVQTARGRYPAVTDTVDGSSETYIRNDFGLTGTWLATGQSSFDGRISIGRQSYSHSTATGFSGTTGQLTWNYKPTGKLSFTTMLIRDTGFDSGFLTLTSVGVGAPTNDTSRLTSTIALSSTYAVTGKIGLNAGGRYAHRSLSNSVNVQAGSPDLVVSGSDNIESEYFGATYAPLRSVQLGCTLSHDSRSVSSSLPAYLSYPYSTNTVGCTAQFTVQ